MENKHINPWLHIWTEPRKTLRSILNTDPRRLILWLAIVGGILSAFSMTLILWVRSPYNQTLQHPFFIGGALIAGIVMGIFHLYFGGWIYTLTGSWLGGKGNFTDLKCAVGWSNYPFIVTTLLNILSFIVFPHFVIQAIFAFLNLVAAIWGLVIFMNLIGEAHRFSAWKGLLTFLIALVLIIAVFMIISLIVPLVTPLFQ